MDSLTAQITYEPEKVARKGKNKQQSEYAGILNPK